MALFVVLVAVVKVVSDDEIGSSVTAAVQEASMSRLNCHFDEPVMHGATPRTQTVRRWRQGD